MTDVCDPIKETKDKLCAGSAEKCTELARTVVSYPKGEMDVSCCGGGRSKLLAKHDAFASSLSVEKTKVENYLSKMPLAPDRAVWCRGGRAGLRGFQEREVRGGSWGGCMEPGDKHLW